MRRLFLSYGAQLMAFSMSVALWPTASIVAAEPNPETGQFVRVSPRDHRYFELSDGRPYIPVGPNLVGPGWHTRDDTEKGLAEVDAWMKSLAAHQGNYVRIWLGHPFWDVEHEKSGEYDPRRAERIDRLLALARKYRIRLKLCLEYFRSVDPKWRDTKGAFPKPLHHVSNGGPFTDMTDFLTSEKGRAQFKRKLDWFEGRYGDDPIVFGWELWNEMDCIRGQGWRPWTVEMLGELHARFPKNLAMQSLGSYDREGKRERYRDVCRMPGNDVAQVHRYLDLGAQWQVCHGPMDLLASDAVREVIAFQVDKPVLLAETGGVQPRHTGPIEYYEKDTAGMLLHDVLFAPFFSGAAGPGQIWHWGVYVHEQNLWYHFGRFAEAVKQLDPPAEHFTPVQIAHPRLRIYVLHGKHTTLAWCRDSLNTWQTEWRDGVAPEVIEDAVVDLSRCVPASRRHSVEIYDPWKDTWSAADARDATTRLPAFSRSLVIRVSHDD
jgi:hypothetical protein